MVNLKLKKVIGVRPGSRPDVAWPSYKKKNINSLMFEDPCWVFFSSLFYYFLLFYKTWLSKLVLTGKFYFVFIFV